MNISTLVGQCQVNQMLKFNMKTKWDFHMFSNNIYMQGNKKTTNPWFKKNTTNVKSNTQMSENVKIEGQCQVQGHQMKNLNISKNWDLIGTIFGWINERK